MDVAADTTATFWYGCNLTRHGEVVRLTTQLLEAAGITAAPAGGPAHCCGSSKESSARIAEGMGRRTVEAFNAAGHGTVITWCPSCHMNMGDFMSAHTPATFETLHVTEALHARRARLVPLLTNAVPARVLLHAHLGFQGRVPVNDLVADLLRLVPGLEVVAHPYRAPGHMCSSIAGVPGALADAQRATLAAMAEAGADTLATVFHSCHRESVILARHGIRVANWIHLLAAAAGWEFEDGYQAWRNADDPRAEIGAARIEALGEVPYERLVAPELAKAPTV